MTPLGIITPLPCAIPIFQTLPQPARIVQRAEFCSKQILTRKKLVPETTDIVIWLIKTENKHSDQVVSDPRWLLGNTRFVIVAGSDTSSSALTHIFHHLANELTIVPKVREKLGIIYTPGQRLSAGYSRCKTSERCHQRCFALTACSKWIADTGALGGYHG
jgi:hypothetical protein